MSSPNTPVSSLASRGNPPPSLLSMEDVPVRTQMRDLFQLAFEHGASDIHLTEHAPPILRINGQLGAMNVAPLSRGRTKQLIYSLLTDQQKIQFEQELELDLSIEASGVGRVRVNVHLQRGSVEAAFRLIPSRIPALSELGLPPVVGELTRKPNGLVLITGPTGAGKTTMLAAMVDLLNHERRSHILLIEDPIEYMHHNDLSMIKQREVYWDTKSFANALVRALRQDPDIIVVGEMRDLDTMATALTAAETGHLVLATLHTPDAAQTVDRILDVFPPHRQEEVKVQLSDCLQGVVSQQLLPRCDASGRVLAYEIMIGTPAIRNLIREHATEQIHTALQTGAPYGMCTMDACLKDLCDRHLISQQTATSRMKHPSAYFRNS